MISLVKVLRQNSKASALKILSDTSRIINSEEIDLPGNNDNINVKIVDNVADFIETNLKSNENCTKDTKYSIIRAFFGQRQL